MEMRVLLCLFIISCSCCCNARDLLAAHFDEKNEMISAEPYYKLSEGGAQQMKDANKDENLCSLCKKFSAEAHTYLAENKTQTEIISILHESCSRIPAFKEQCITLVDYYSTLFFMEIYSVDPDTFCQNVGLCKKTVPTSYPLSQDKCDLCHTAVTEILLKLKDPDTELQIIEMLLKACNSAGANRNKCKRLVFEYAPIILIDAERYIETNNVCEAFHVCGSDEVGAVREMLPTKTHLDSSS